MKAFVSYAFNDANKWVAELVIPLAKALGFEVVTGQQIEGEVLIDAVDARLRGCAGCLAFTTRRNKRGDGTYETHPWVINELTKARTLGFKTVEVREDGVKIGDEHEAYVRLKYTEAQRDRMLIELANVLATWIIKPVRVQLLPPPDTKREFTGQVVKGDVKCSYSLQSRGQQVGKGEAIIQPFQAGFFIDIEIPREDVIVKLEVKKTKKNGAWMSLGDGLLAIPVQLFNT